MERRSFLQLTSLASLGLLFGSAKLSASLLNWESEPTHSLTSIRGGSSVFVNRGGNVGLFETSEGYVVVDSQFPQFIQVLLDQLTKSGKPILYLANTHHHGDHTSGNILFTDLKKGLVAQKEVPALQRNAAEANSSLDKQKYADILFEKEFTFDLGKDKMKGYHFGAGHTKGDAVYHFENDNVVHMGDLMFKDMIPVYRKRDGASITGWIDILEKVIGKFDTETRFIFGHSADPTKNFGTQEDLVEMKSFLEATKEFVQKAMKKGQITEELVKEHKYIPGFANRETPERFQGFLEEVRSTLL